MRFCSSKTLSAKYTFRNTRIYIKTEFGIKPYLYKLSFSQMSIIKSKYPSPMTDDHLEV